VTDRCAATTSRARQFSSEESDCRPTDEQREAQAVDREQEAEREAEARRNRYFEHGTDEGGRSARASSDAAHYSPMLHDDSRLKDSLRTAAVDRPLEDDRYGNAIAGAVAGGVISGVRVAATEVLAVSAGTRPVIQHVAVAVNVDVAKSVVTTAVTSTMKAAPEGALPAPPSPPRATPARDPIPAGRSGAKATSEVVEESNQSVAPRYSPFVIQG